MPWQEVIKVLNKNKEKICCGVKSKKGNTYEAWIGPWTKWTPNNLRSKVSDKKWKILGNVVFGKYANIMDMRQEVKD